MTEDVASSSPDRRTYRLVFAALVAGAAVVRLGYVAAAKPGDEVVGDQLHYFGQAARIADGRWFEHPWMSDAYSALHPPLTALALSPVSWVDDNLSLTQRYAMAVYGTLVVAGIGLLARGLLGRWVSLAATAVAAVYANLWINDALIMSETFAAGTVVAVLLAVYAYDRRADLLIAGALGATVGLAGLARSELLLLGTVLVVPLTLRAGDLAWRTRISHLAVAGAVAVLVVSPWVIRNQIRFDEPTFMSTQDGLTLAGANCEETYSGDEIGWWSLACTRRVPIPEGADESVQSRIYREEAVDFVGDHLDRVPVVVAARLGRGLSVWETEQVIRFNQFEGREPWASRIGLWQYWLLAPLAAYGLWRWPSRQPRWPLLAVTALSVAMIAFVYGIPRFRIAAEVAIVVGAAVAIVDVAQRFGEWRAARSGATVRS